MYIISSNHKPLVLKLVLMVFIMFAFTFALIPLYTVFCKVTGLNGKVDTQHPGTFSRYKIENFASNNRTVTVEFIVTLNQALACEFHPEHTALQVKPGELTFTSYRVKNLTRKKMIVQAIPSISPGLAAKYLKKLECFCFTQQILQPGEELTLPLRFWLEPDIPSHVYRLTLSYTLFDVTNLHKES